MVNDLVILNDDQEKSPSALYAFDRVTGKQKWKLDRRSTGKVEEIAHSGTPLGTLGDAYNDIAFDFSAGDTLVFMSDGFPELMNISSQQLGYAAACDTFAAAATADDSDAVIASLAESVRRWHGDQPPNDDVTFVVVRST